MVTTKYCGICGCEINGMRKYCRQCDAHVRNKRSGGKNFSGADIGTPEDGYIALAARIVGEEMQSYRLALSAYKEHGNIADLLYALAIEKWLTSDYYAILTCGADMEQILLRVRKECGLSEKYGRRIE